jgi:Fe2+ or Zn2+ uptake regulation protein
MNAAQLRHHLTEILSTANSPMTTSALLTELASRNTSCARPIVVEQVYRGLRILADKGVVQRVNGHPGRAAHWTSTRSTPH